MNKNSSGAWVISQFVRTPGSNVKNWRITIPDKWGF